MEADRISGGSLERLREANRLRVVEALRLRGSASRADLVEITGLSRTTITSLLGDLHARGLITADPTDTERAERPARAAAGAAAARALGRGGARRRVRPQPRPRGDLGPLLDRPRRAATGARRRRFGVRGTRRRGGADRQRARARPASAASRSWPPAWACQGRSRCRRAASDRPRSCRVGRACTPPRRWPRACATSTSRRSTTPISARWPRRRWAPARASATSST